MTDKGKSISCLVLSGIGWLILVIGFLYEKYSPGANEFSPLIDYLVYILFSIAASLIHLLNCIYAVIFLLRRARHRIFCVLGLLSSVSFVIFCSIPLLVFYARRRTKKKLSMSSICDGLNIQEIKSILREKYNLIKIPLPLFFLNPRLIKKPYRDPVEVPILTVLICPVESISYPWKATRILYNLCLFPRMETVLYPAGVMERLFYGILKKE